MCFSAEASFVGGVTLVVIGAATIRKVKSPSQIMFASIPLLFGLQQLAEGFLWISLPNPEAKLMQQVSIKFFLFFSNVLWPIWVPLSIYNIEKNKKVKKIVALLTGIGIIVAVFYTATLLLQKVNPQIIEHHIKYGFKPLTPLHMGILVLYVLATIPPFFLSSYTYVRYFGAIMLVGLLVSLIFYLQCLTSVWCFFGAIISIVIYFILKKIDDENPPKTIPR